MSSGPLNLAGADLKGFDAIPSGTYPATIFSVELKETKGGENAKLPTGTPMWNVQFRIVDDHEYHNRRFFRQYVIAPEKVDGKKYANKAMMDGMLARFLMAIGYTEEEITSGSFDPTFEDMAGRECMIVVGQKPDYNDATLTVNEVKGVKPFTDSETSGGGIL